MFNNKEKDRKSVGEKVIFCHIENLRNEWCIFSGVKVLLTYTQLMESENSYFELEKTGTYIPINPLFLKYNSLHFQRYLCVQ